MRGIESIKTQPAGGDLVEHRCFDVRMAVIAGLLPAVIVPHQQHEIRRRGYGEHRTENDECPPQQQTLDTDSMKFEATTKAGPQRRRRVNVSPNDCGSKVQHGMLVDNRESRGRALVKTNRGAGPSLRSGHGSGDQTAYSATAVAAARRTSATPVTRPLRTRIE